MEKNIFMELLAAREFKAIRSILNVMNAVDIASLLSEFEEKELAQAFRLIPKAKAAEVFANMSNATQSCLINAFTETELKEIIDDMFGRYRGFTGRFTGKCRNKDFIQYQSAEACAD